MKAHIEQWRFLRFVPAICCAVGLTFNPVEVNRAFAAQNDARLDSADLAKLEPPLTLEALIARIGFIAQRGLGGSENIYTESVLSRLFGAKIIKLRSVDDAPGDAGARRRHVVSFFTPQFTLPYTSGDGLHIQGVKTKFDGTWIQYQYGNRRLTLNFDFSDGGPDRSALEAMLGMKLVREPSQPAPPHAAAATSRDGYTWLRLDTQANPLVASIEIFLGSDGRVNLIDLVQDDLDQPTK